PERARTATIESAHASGVVVRSSPGGMETSKASTRRAARTPLGRHRAPPRVISRPERSIAMAHKTLSLFDLAPGKILLDRFKIQKTNRMGGMATTFVVEDPKEKRTLEVQVFPSALFESVRQANDFAV